MIIKNEGDKIFNTLCSIWESFDQLVIVDTGSTDNTKEEVNRFISEIKPNYSVDCKEFKWCDDFSAARNFSYTFAKCDYITWWDADDKMTEGLRDFINLFKLSEELIGVVKIPTIVGINKENNDAKFVINDRIVARVLNPHWVYRIHEQLIYNPLDNLKVLDACKYNKVYVDAIKDYSNTHHYDFYCRLINQGYHFQLHDYYFFFNEMINTCNFEKWEWFKDNFLQCLKEETDYPSYSMMIYQKAKELPDFFMKEFEDLKVPIFFQLINYHDAEPITLFEMAKYFEEKGKKEFSKILFNGVITTKAVNDYDMVTGEKIKSVAAQILKDKSNGYY